MRSAPVPFFAFYSEMEDDRQLWELLDVVHRSNAVAMVGRYAPDGTRALLAGVAPWWIILAGLTAIASQTHTTGELMVALNVYMEANMTTEDASGVVVPYPGADSTERGSN